MKYTSVFILILIITGCAAAPRYTPYWFENGDDFVEDGAYRIVDKKGRLGYADAKGKVIIKPRFAFGYPFENGTALVTCKGESKEVEGSRGEYHYWDSDEWFYIDKQGNKTGRKVD